MSELPKFEINNASSYTEVAESLGYFETLEITAKRKVVTSLAKKRYENPQNEEISTEFTDKYIEYDDLVRARVLDLDKSDTSNYEYLNIAMNVMQAQIYSDAGDTQRLVGSLENAINHSMYLNELKKVTKNLIAKQAAASESLTGEEGNTDEM